MPGDKGLGQESSFHRPGERASCFLCFLFLLTGRLQVRGVFPSFLTGKTLALPSSGAASPSLLSAPQCMPPPSGSCYLPP